MHVCYKSSAGIGVETGIRLWNNKIQLLEKVGNEMGWHVGDKIFINIVTKFHT